jgi:hypothetical protein
LVRLLDQVLKLMSFPQLANALRQVAKTAKHPNALLYQFQLERAKKKYLAEGKQLGDGLDGVVALGAPKEENELGKAEMGKSGSEGAVSEKDEGKKEGDGAGGGGGAEIGGKA